MSIFELLEKARKEAMLKVLVREGGYRLPLVMRSLFQFKENYYIMYEEDLSNLLCQTNTIITKN